jgi:predicted Zn-dependent peptidase
MTTPDFTCFQAVVPSGALALALYVESERMAFTLEKLDEKALALERSIIDRETKLGHLSSASTFAQDTVNAFFGEQHPYYDAAQGRTELHDVELAEVQAFFQRGYRPDAAHLVLVGDFEIPAARKLVETYFGSIVAPKMPKRSDLVPAPAPARALVLRRAVPFEQLIVSWAAPSFGTGAAVASELFARQLSKTLRRRLLEESFSVTSIATPLTQLDASAVLVIRLTVREDIKVASALFEKELGRIWETDWAARLPQLRRELVLTRRARRESLSNIAMEHLISMRVQRRPFDFNLYLQQLASVTPQQMRALSHYYAGDKAMVGWLLRVGATPGERAKTGLTVEPR